jgi:hypothetical protein
MWRDSKMLKRRPLVDETTAENTIRWYEDLEVQLIEVLRFIPPQESNLTTWSPKLATIMVEACNLLESVLYHITPFTHDAQGNDMVDMEGKFKKRNGLDLRDYAVLYASSLQLSHRQVAVFQAPFHWRNSFSAWASASGHDFPKLEWWDIHNRSKHRRLDHHPEFTLDRALDALAGAIATLVSAPRLRAAIPLVHGMIRHRWFDVPSEFADNLEDFYSGHFGEKYWYCAETSLFAVPIGQEPLPKDLRAILGERMYGGKKLKQWLRG